MISRHIEQELRQLLTEYPVVTILGARQSGKATLAQELLADWDYCNLEAPEIRQLAEDDPKAFLAQFPDRVILDEIQRVPELLSYIQVSVDENQRPTQAYSNYYQTYVERDVRQLINLRDLAVFEKFFKLLAGRVGQLMDYSSLANDVGVSATAVRQWLSILEASFIVFKLSAYYEDIGKRVVKSPKYFFTDTGLLAFLLGIEKPDQVARDPLIGQLFENLVVIECLKTRANQGKTPNLYFFRDSNGNEVDILFESGRELVAIEVKSSATYRQELLKGLKRLRVLTPNIRQSYLVYAGEPFVFSDGITALRYDQVDRVFANLETPSGN